MPSCFMCMGSTTLGASTWLSASHCHTCIITDDGNSLPLNPIR